MAQIIGVSTPRDFHVRKHISIVDRKNGLTRLIDVLRALSEEVRIVLLIKGAKFSRQFVGCLLAGVVACFQQFNAFLLDVSQSDGNITKREGFVDGAVRQVEDVCRTIMAVHTLHIVFRQRL